MASNHLLVTALTSVHPYRRPGLQDWKVLHFGSLTRVQSRRCRSQPSGALQQNSFSSEAHKSLQTENPEEESDVLIKNRIFRELNLKYAGVFRELIFKCQKIKHI